MFRGENSISLDAKGRLGVPTKYRAILQETCERQMVVTMAMNGQGARIPGCLWLFPLPEWEKLENTISKLPTLNPITTRLKRFLIGKSAECEVDGQGRLLIPENLRKAANLEKRIVLMGQLNKFEIWNDQEWAMQEEEFSTEIEDTPENREIMSSIVF